MGFYVTHDSRRRCAGTKLPANRCIDISRGQAWKLAAATWPDERDRDARFVAMVNSTPGATVIRLRRLLA